MLMEYRKILSQCEILSSQVQPVIYNEKKTFTTGSL